MLVIIIVTVIKAYVKATNKNQGQVVYHLKQLMTFLTLVTVNFFEVSRLNRIVFYKIRANQFILTKNEIIKQLTFITSKVSCLIIYCILFSTNYCYLIVRVAESLIEPSTEKAKTVVFPFFTPLTNPLSSIDAIDASDVNQISEVSVAKLGVITDLY